MKRQYLSLLRRHPNIVKALIFLALALLLIGSALLLFWQKIFYREEIAKLLPADSTLAFAEINLDQNSPQVKQFQEVFQGHPFLSASGMTSYSHQLIPDLDQIQPWFDGRLGVALITLKNHGDPALVFLAKVKDRQLAAEYVKSSQQSQNLLLLNSSDYLLMSDHPEVFQLINSALKNSNQLLYNSPRFHQIYSALPQQNLLFAYLDSNQIFNSLADNPNFLDRKLDLFQKYLPFLGLFSADGLSLYLETQNGKPALTAQQLSLFDQTKLPNPAYFHTTYSLTGGLLSLLPDQSDLQLSSSHLLDQKNKLQQIFANRSTVQDLIFSGNLEQLKQTYLGDNLDLDRDFFPIFEHEFALSVDSISEAAFSLTLDLGNNIDQSKVQNLLLAIAKQVDLESSAQKETFTLPDDTTGEKIVAHPAEPNFEQVPIDHQIVQKITFNGQLDCYFTFQGNLLLASTHLNKLQEMLTKYQQKTSNNSAQFFSQLDGITEYYNFNLTKIIADLGKAQFNIFFKPFSQLKIGRKFSEIGLLSIYRLE